MPDTTTLLDDRVAEFGYVLLIDGCPYGFGTHAGHAELDTGEGHTILPYLQREGTLASGVDVRTGKVEQHTGTFRLVDFAGNILSTLFSTLDDGVELLETHIEAGEDLTARTDLHGMHVGTEAIGPSGERHRWPWIPGSRVGMFHPGTLMGHPDVEGAPVSSSPVIWRGRRVALYMVARDHVEFPVASLDDGAGGVLGLDQLGAFVLGSAGGTVTDIDTTWRPFGEARRVWMGVLKDQGQTDGYSWELECDGHFRLLEGELGRLTTRTPARAIPLVQLGNTPGNDESRVGIWLYNRDSPGSGGAVNETFASDNFTTVLTGTTPGELRGQIATAITAAANSAGTDGVFADTRGQHVAMDTVSGAIQIAIEDGVTPYVAEMLLFMHARVWAAIGYDIPYQNGLTVGEPLFVPFQDPAPGFAVPGDGYVQATLRTSPPGANNAPDNDGVPWFYFPRYDGGTSTLSPDLGEGGLVVDLDNEFAGTEIAHRGQINRPPLADPDDPTSPYVMPSGAFAVNDAVNRQGYWLFFGKRAFGSSNGEPIEIDEYWVGRASWTSRALSGWGLVADSRIVVHEWLPPSQFGYDRPLPQSDWVVRTSGNNRIQAVPILYFGFNTGGALDRVDHVIDRVLRSTGTSGGWFTDPPTYSVPGYDGNLQVTQEPGENESADGFFYRRDGEVEDMGLGLPTEIVGSSIEMALVVDALPAGLGWIKLGASPGISATDLLDGMMRPFGLGWHLRGGRFGLMSLHKPVEIDQVEHVLTQADKVAPGSASTQRLRAFAPIDTFKLRYNWAPHLNRMRGDVEHISHDKGRWYRPGALPLEIDAHGVTLNHDGFRELYGEIGRWWERRHFFLEGWVMMGREPVYFGDRVRITEPRAVSPDGTVGITAMRGIVAESVLDLETGLWSARIFVHDDTNGLPRFHGPIVRGVGYDTDNDRAYVADNWLAFDTSGTWSDASYMVEPSFDGLGTIGGDATVYGVQWDGVQWALAVTATCTGVDTTPGSSYLQLSAVTGTYLHKRDTVWIMAPRGVQTAQWVLDILAVICDKAGEFNATNGPNWEK